MTTEVVPKVHITVLLRADDDSMSATTVLEGLAEAIRGYGDAPIHADRDPGLPGFAPDLAVARSLRDLYRQLLESVHERVDRATGDI